MAPVTERAGFGLKERAWDDRALLGLWRARWAELANARLAALGHDVRIDHRSNAARAIELEPQNKIGPAGARRAARGEEAARAAEHRAIARRNGARLLADPALALQLLTQAQSTFTRQDLARLVSGQTDGAEQFAAVMAQVEALPELVRVGVDGRGRARFSTEAMVELERQMEAAAVGLDRQVRHGVALAARQAPPPTAQGHRLEAEQLQAFQHVTRARGLAVVSGVAGSGKSTMLDVAGQVWTAAGYRVRGAALSGIAAEGLEAGSGIESRTLASLEYAWAQGRELLEARDVLVVDEAGMIGSRQMGRVLAAAGAAGAKVVLVGDAEQLQAIEAGAAFRAIAERVGVAGITEVRRQRTTWQREATRALASGRTAAALDRYRAAGMVQAHATLDAAKDQLVARAELDDAARPGLSQIILAHRRADVADLNARVRARRAESGLLGPDQVLPLGGGERALAEGDRVYFLRNERGLSVKNGTLGTVRRIEGTGEAAWLAVQLDGSAGVGRGAVVRFGLAEYADLDHGYAATVHKAQSVTVDRSYVLASAGMDRHLAYVALSRHRDAVSLHWSADTFADAAGLARQLGRERAKDTTLDYAAGDPAATAAYAERRGLDPLRPDSAIVVRRESAQVTDPAPNEYDPATIEILKDIEITRRRPKDAVVYDVPEAQDAPATPATPDPASSDPPTEAAPTPKPPLGLFDGLRLGGGSSAPPPAPPASVPPLAVERTPPKPEPMLRAEPLRPVTAAEVAALVRQAWAASRDIVQEALVTAYRDPVAARVRLDALLRQAKGSEAEAAALLRAQGPSLLGKLRGRKGLLASENAMSERVEAEWAAKALPDALVRRRTSRDALEYITWSTLADERQRVTVEVPGLSTEAAGVLQALQDAGAAGVVSQGVAISAMSGGEQQRAATVAQVWGGVLSRPEFKAELERFEAAVLERFTLERRGALFQEWEAREALRFSASTLRLPRSGEAMRVGPPDLPPLASAISAAVFVRMIGHARVLTPLQQAHEVRLAQDADAPLRAVRERLVAERMAPWVQAESFRQAEWTMGQARRPRAERMPQAEANARREGRIAAERARIDAEVRALPHAELLRIKAILDAQDQQAEAEARTQAQRSAAQPSVGPRLTPW